MKIDPKRAGLIAFVLIAFILTLEITLSALRNRTIEIVFHVEGEIPQVAAVPEATPAPDQPTATEVLFIGPSSTLVTTIQWTYHIGPRFPVTTIRAAVQDESGKTVAATSHTIQCGSDALSCVGDTPLALTFGVVDGAGTATQWPIGRYTVTVTRTYAGVENAPSVLTARPLTVLNK